MKISVLLSIIVTLFAVGCGEKSNSTGQGTNAATGGSLVTAPVDYLDAAGKAQRSAVKTVDTASINKAIEMFNVDKGRFPNDLNELVTEKYIPQIPAAPYGMKLEYNATAGNVRVVKQ